MNKGDRYFSGNHFNVFGDSFTFFRWFNSQDIIKSMRIVNGAEALANISTTKYKVDIPLNFQIISDQKAWATNLTRFKIMLVADKFIFIHD